MNTMSSVDVLKKVLAHLREVEQLLHDSADASVKLELQKAIVEIEDHLQGRKPMDTRLVWVLVGNLLLKLPEIAEMLERFRK